MYLLAVTMIMFGLIGLYSQLSVMMSTRAYNKMTGIGQMFWIYHATGKALAPVLAAAETAPNIIGTATKECSLNKSATASTVPPACKALDPAAILDSCGGTNCKDTELPPNANPEFYSVVFTQTSVTNPGRVLVTYAKVIGKAVNFANNSPITITPGDLIQQMKNIGVSTSQYGVVIGGTLTVLTGIGTQPPAQYSMKNAAGTTMVQDGSIAIVDTF